MALFVLDSLLGEFPLSAVANRFEFRFQDNKQLMLGLRNLFFFFF